MFFSLIVFIGCEFYGDYWYCDGFVFIIIVIVMISGVVFGIGVFVIISIGFVVIVGVVVVYGGVGVVVGVLGLVGFMIVGIWCVLFGFFVWILGSFGC